MRTVALEITYFSHILQIMYTSSPTVTLGLSLFMDKLYAVNVFGNTLQITHLVSSRWCFKNISVLPWRKNIWLVSFQTYPCKLIRHLILSNSCLSVNSDKTCTFLGICLSCTSDIICPNLVLMYLCAKTDGISLWKRTLGSDAILLSLLCA